MKDFVGYSVEDNSKFLDNLILLARKSSSDSDTLYLHKALKVPDEAMLEEIILHIKKSNLEPVLKSDLLVNKTIVPAVWAMRRKRRIDNQEVYKWKSK
jgi:hypothetical protein